MYASYNNMEAIACMKKEEIVSRVQETKAFFASNITKSYHFRTEQLQQLSTAISSYQQPLIDALYKDLHKVSLETYLTEIGIVQAEIRFLLKHLKRLMKPKRVPTPFTHFLASSTVYYEPYGVALIMSPWNYPVNLTLTPLAGAIAAGNCTVVKPSNYSSETSKVIAELITQTFDSRFITVVTGGHEENTGLLEQQFDYIFFTGGATVGKLVMEAAARHLTPLTLELGGKSPCIIDKSADLKAAARQILFGKLLNSGQTCVAPDYVLIHEYVKEAFIECCKTALRDFLPTDAYIACNVPRIINDKHFKRLLHLIEEKHVVIGGEADVYTRFIPLTVLDNINFDAPIMQEEIFGPILPLITFSDLQWAIEQIRARPKPLALYLFTKDRAVEQKILTELSFGGGCINDTIVHLANPFMPFGGVGASGLGSYHGKQSFYTFSHKKSVMKKSLSIDLPMRYHPYNEKKFNLIKKFM